MNKFDILIFCVSGNWIKVKDSSGPSLSSFLFLLHMLYVRIMIYCISLEYFIIMNYICGKEVDFEHIPVASS